MLRAGTWLAIGLGGLAVAVVGARIFAGAVDGYIAANPFFWKDFYNVPAPADAESHQAVAGTILLLSGGAAAAVASLIRLTTTRRRWLVARAVAAVVSPLVLAAIGLSGWFQLYVDTLCGDCTPPPPDPPWPAFSAGAAVLIWMIPLGLALCLVLAVVAIRRRSPASPAPAV